MTNRRFTHVVFTDDFFRCASNGLQYNAPNRRFLRGFFDAALGRLGLPMQEVAPLCAGGGIDVDALMAQLGLPRTPAGWARACVAELGALRGTHGMPAFGPGCLAIGWGLTPALQRCIDASGAAYLDIEIDPRRFTEHLHFCVRTNDAAIEAMLRARRVDEELFWNHAAAHKGHCARHGGGALFDARLRVGVFFGQSLVDLSLVSDGRISHPSGVIAPLRALAQSVDLLVIKPHPYEPALHDLAPIARAIPNVAWTHENTYALLSADNVHFAASLSSSVLQEARYFGKPGHALVDADRNARNRLPGRCSAWMAVGADLGAMDCVGAMVRGGTGIGAPAAAGGVASWPAAAIDRAFMTRWGFDERSLGLPALPELRLGHPYALRAGSPAVRWLSHGWAAPGARGTRSADDIACVVVPLPSLAAPCAGAPSTQGQRLEVRVDYRCDTRATSVLAMIDGVVLPNQRSTGTGRRTLVFEVRPSPGRKCLVLQFAVAATGPRRGAAGPSFTVRRLSVSLRGAGGTGRVVAATPAERVRAMAASAWAELYPARVRVQRVLKGMAGSAAAAAKDRAT